MLLDNGALVCASPGGYGYFSSKLYEFVLDKCLWCFIEIDQTMIRSYAGSTPLHLAARSGSLECVRILLAWGADRLQLDSSG